MKTHNEQEPTRVVAGQGSDDPLDSDTSELSGLPTEPALRRPVGPTSESREISLAATGGMTDVLRPPRGPGEIGRVGPFRIIRLLGAGGMGAVFEAVDPQLGRSIALKVMLTRTAISSVARKRFLREARAAAALDHDHVVSIYQVGEDRGVPYLAMPLLVGQSLRDRLAGNKPLPIAEVLRIGREIADGLAAAHDRGLIHRDIKPENVWLEEGKGRVKILDFGLARAANEAGRLTKDGIVMGTPAYMAPEQATGRSKIDPRTDLYSLGAVLYRMATGMPAFAESTPAAMLVALMTETPTPPAELNPAVPPALNQLIRQMMDRDATKRPATARRVVEAIRAIETATEAGAPVMLDIRIDEPARAVARPSTPRREWVRLVLATALAVVVTGVAVYGFGLVPKLRDLLNDEGRLTLESPVAMVAVAVVQEGRTVAVVDPQTHPTLRLKPGSYRLELNDPYGTLALLPDRFTIARGEDRLVRVVGKPHAPSSLWEAADVERWPNPPEDDDWPVGLIPRPARLDDGRRWQVEPRRPKRSAAAVAWSPDGRRLVCATGEPLVRIYEHGNLAVAGVLVGHAKGVYAAAWSRDGKTIATGDDDGTIRLWSGDGVPGPVLQGHSTRVLSLAWSHDGRKLASSSQRSARIWNSDGTPGPVLEVHSGDVAAVAWSPDGKQLATAGGDGTVRLWRSDGTPGTVVRMHNVPMTSVVWSPDGTHLAAGGHDGAVRTWNTAGSGGAHGPALKGGRSSVAGLAWSPDGKNLAWVDSANVLRLWNVSRSPRKVWETSATAGQCVSWSADGKHLATGGPGCAVRIWSAGGEEEQAAATSTSVHAAAIRGDGQRCATILNEDPRIIALWSPHGAASVFVKTPNPVGCVAWNPEGTRLAIGDDRGNVCLKEADASAGRHVNGHAGPVLAIAWNRQGDRVASTGSDGAVRIWDAHGAPGATLHVPATSIVEAAWLADGERLLTCSADGALRIWDGDGKAERIFSRIKPDGFAAAWNPDGTRAVSTSRSAEVLFWNNDGTAGRPRVPKIVVAGATGEAVWHPDGQRLAFASRSDPFVPLSNIDGASGPTLAMRGAERVPWVAWSRAGERLVAIGDNGLTRCWKTRTLEPEWVALATSPFDGVSFGPDGRVLESTPAGLKDLLFLVERSKGGTDLLSYEEVVKRAR